MKAAAEKISDETPTVALDEASDKAKGKEKPDEAKLDGTNFAVTTLQKLGYGETLEEFGEKLHKLIKHVGATGRKGAITLQIGVKCRGQKGQIEFSDKITPTYPDTDRGTAIYFTNEHGQVLKDDPNQRKFQFGEDDDDAPTRAS